MNKKKGFTLIELLVVIAIIGILAAIVLVSLTGARNKAKDARIQSEISQIRAIAEMVWDEEKKYDGLEIAAGAALNTAHEKYGTQLTTINADVVAQGGTDPVYAQALNDQYCVYSKLNDGDFFCIDARGKAVKGPDDADDPATHCTGTGATFYQCD